MVSRRLLAPLACLLFMASCSSSKFLSDGEYLLDKVRVETDAKEVDASQMSTYIHQQANSKWFSLFKVPLGTYAMAGRDTTKWLNRTLRNIGEEPVVYDSLLAKQTCEDLQDALHNMGYMNGYVTLDTKKHGHKLTAIYKLHPGIPYFIRSVKYDIQDDTVAKVLDIEHAKNLYLKEGMKFSATELDNARKQITQQLTHAGFYRFHKDFIRFYADTTRGSKMVDLTMQLMPYQSHNDAEVTFHPRYKIRQVNFMSGDDGKLHLRRSVLRENTWLKEGDFYSSQNLQRTYNSFGRLSAVRYTSVRFAEVPDSNLLDCNIQISTNKPNSVSFQPEGTNTAGDLGAAATLTYENRNLFKGSETFSVQLRGAFEAITGLEGYQNQDYEEYNLEAKLSFPRFIAPVSKNYRKKSSAASELSVSYNMQNRPEFHRRLFSAAWRYRWTDANRNTTSRADVIDLNYIYMPWISSTFKHDYLDSVSNRNAILRYNYEDLFIMKIGFSLAHNGRHHAFRANLETAGNLLNGFSHLLGEDKNERGQYTLFNIAYAQYVKGDVDYTHLIRFDRRNQLALHAGFGIAYPYGNSRILPFEKRYFSGGANSVRGWSVRGLGPGKFKGTNGAIDFINQTGDMKLDLNAEYRTFLFWKFDGAVFVDAGNIWTLRNYEEQPGGQFKLDEFYQQIAVAYGIGLRLNFDYFVLRFDMGMKAVNPAYEDHKEHFPIVNPRLSRDFSFHFAVGLPF